MKSWKARVLILATMLAMLIALARRRWPMTLISKRPGQFAFG